MPLGSPREIRVLHVDDDPSITDLTGTFLEREDGRFAVEAATSADEGLEKLRDHPPDCVVSDYNMPGMDGIEFLRAVRAEYPDLPFILYTGKGSEAVASDAISAGVTDYLQKQSGTEQYQLLANRIRNAVRAQREAKRADRKDELMRLTEVLGDTGGFELNAETGAVTMTDGTRRILHLPDQANPDFEKNLQHYHPDDREEIRRTIERTLQTGEQTQGTWRYQHPDAEEQQLLNITYTPTTADGDTTICGAIHDVTDREERRRELHRLQQAIDDANVPITLADPSQADDPLVYVNNAFEEMTGYSPEETLGRNCRFLQGEDTDPETVAALREALDNEEQRSVELRNYRKDGTEFWNRLTVTPIYDDDGKLVRYLGTQEDVTERKERERELRAERRFIEQALDTLDDLFYVLDTDGSFRRWNERVPQTTGYTDPELADMRAIELFPEDDRETIADAIQMAVSGETMTVEADLLTADGERRPYEFTGARLTDADGTVTGLVGIGRDLTERRRRERRFRALLEESSDVISVLDRNGRYQYQSPSIERVLGYDPEETLGDTAWEYVHPDDRERVRDQFETWVDTPDQRGDTTEYRARDADGSWRWMEARGNNQLDNPAVEGYIVNSREITTRKERKDELAHTHDLMSNMEQLAGVGAWEYDSGAGTLVLTDGACGIYGLEPDAELTLEDAFGYFHPEDRDRLTDRFGECLETGTPYELDLRLTTAEGATRWVAVRGERVDEPGSDGVVRGYIRDITEEKTRERQLTELNQTLQDLLTAETRQEVADIGVGAAKEILDLRANAVHLCEDDDTLAPVAQTDELTSLLDGVPALSVADSIAGRVYRNGEPTVVEDARRDPDVHELETDLRGHVYLPLADHGVLIAGSREEAAFDRQDRAAGELLAGNLTAAFDRIESEQTVSRQQQQLSLFFSESPLGAVQWDDEFRVERLNERAEEILGYSEAELRRKPWKTIVAEADSDYVGDVVEQLLAADGGTRAVNRNVRQDGETRTCKWHNRVVTGADGSVQTIFSKFEDITEQEERKRELREVNGQYRALVDNFPDGAVFLYDTDLQVVRAGGSELESVGLSPDDIEGTTPHDRYSPEIAEELVDHIRSSFTGERHTFEQEYGGEHYRVQVVPVRTDEGEITRVMAVSKNITERKERERELERYERLVENLPVGVFRTTVDGEIIDMNEATTDIYSADSRAQLRSVGVDELYSDDSDRDDLLGRLREAGRVEDELLEFETLDGDRRFVRATITLNEAAESSYLEGILQDVTDRRELEREFAEIKTIAESLNDAVYVIDEHGRFTYVNSEFLELTGYAEETVLGSTPALIKDEETMEVAERQLGRLLSDDGPDNVTFETLIRPKDGDPVTCEDHMGVLPYEGDSFNGSVGVLRDISGRKRRERELRRERDRLDEFASVVSHDLRNPLNVAQGNLELLESECDTGRIEPIERAHTRMSDLVDDLLTLARQGETVSDVEPVALGEIAETAWQTVESPDASLHVETSRTVRCDPSRLQQLLENLYRNAVEHGGPEVTVTVGAADDRFSVGDTGPGIPENEREQVFESGYSTAADGTGFGLRIVEQIAQAHGWTVRVTESESGGARFEVTGVEFADR